MKFEFSHPISSVLRPLRSWMRGLATVGAAMLLSMAVLPAWAQNITFDYESGKSGFFTNDARQAKSGETLRAVSVNDVLGGTFETGAPAIAGADTLFASASYNGETSVTFSLVSGKQFDLTSIAMLEVLDVNNELVTFTSSKGTVTYNLLRGSNGSFVFNVAGHANAANMQGITSFTVTASPTLFMIGFDNIALQNITTPIPPPTATTGSASSITATGAALNGTINDNGANTTVTFDYGLTTAYGTNVAATTGGTVTAGSGSTAVATTLSGLTCNTTYHFRVKGVNSGGTTNGSDASFTTAACVPGAPTMGTATAGDTQASVTFTAPGSNGGAAITGYTVTSSPGGFTGTGANSPVIVTGLTNGTAYTFTVTATNSAGTGSASSASNSVTPKANQTITFTNPGTQNFGTTPTLTATSTSSLTVSFTSSTTGVCTITSGGALTFVTVGACTINADQAGSGAFNAAPTVSRSFTVAAVVPGAPTAATATAGDTQATVSFTAPAFNGGATITGYTVTSNPGGLTGTGANSPITVTGLTNGVAYTFTVTATNSAGTGSASSASNSVTPKANQTITFTNPGAQNFGTTPTLSATSTSSLTVSFTSSTTGVCTITSGGALTFVTVGTCTINADQAGNGAFNAAPTVSRSFNVAAVVPGAPTIGTATAGDTQASVTFTAPGSNGGAAIAGYTATSSPGGLTGTGANSPITVTGLTNGVAYTFTVTATNSAGTGSASSASNSVTPKAAQTITFTNPGTQNFGTTPTLSATSTSSLTVSFSSSTTGVCTITSGGALTFVTVGSCTINADQAGDTSYLTAPTVSRTFTVAAVVPGAPTIGTATAGDTQATVSFTAPAFTGGATITGYTVTSNPGGLTGTGANSPITATGLTNGVAYTFTVTATNSAGTGSASGASNSVTPKASQTITFGNPGPRSMGTSPTLTATATSGLTVAFSSTTPAVCTITGGGTLTFVTAGTCTIHADQAGNASFLAAPQVAQSFSVVATSLSNPVGAGSGSLTASVAGTAPGCGLLTLQTSALTGGALSSAPGNLNFLYGLVSFQVGGGCANGSSATITLTYPQAIPANAQFWKYGRTTSNNVNHWYQLTAASHNLTITGNQISYTLTDGQDGDDDLTANGTIVDPAAPAVPVVDAGITGIPTLSEWAMALLALLMAAITWHHHRRGPMARS